MLLIVDGEVAHGIVFLSGGETSHKPITERLCFLHTQPEGCLAIGGICHPDVDSSNVTSDVFGRLKDNLAVEVFQGPVEAVVGVDADAHGYDCRGCGRLVKRESSSQAAS